MDDDMTKSSKLNVIPENLKFTKDLSGICLYVIRKQDKRQTNMENLEQHIEALIFAAEKPLKFDELATCLEKAFETDFEEEQIKDVLQAIDEKYKANRYAFHLVKSGNGYQFLTKSAYHETVAIMLHNKAKRRLTNSALETLSIIAYKQPITKSEIEQIRGVNSDYAVTKLMEKELVEIVGRSEDVGKPLLYGTSEFFMDYFGINSINDLPKIKEIETTDNEIGNAPEVDAAVQPDNPTDN